MAKFLSDNKDFFVARVARFKPPTSKDKELRNPSSPSNILISARIRPLLASERDANEIIGIYARDADASVDVHELRQKPRGPPAFETSSFKLDRIYGPSKPSEDIYNEMVKPLIPWSWGGGVSTLFAYGQTASGKTYTIDTISRLVVEDIITLASDETRVVNVCIFELIGKNAFDLLNNRRPISILEDSFGETQIVGVVEHQPPSAEEFLSLIATSMTFRTSTPTEKNEDSSRSHAIIRLRIVNKADISAPDGLFFLVDLAGSEASSDTKTHSPELMRESRDINLSLSTLKDCIRGRAMWDLSGGKAKRAFMPFRNTLLTKILKHVFDTKSERSCKTAVLACLKPTALDAGPGKNTLRYAEMLRVVEFKIKASLPVVISTIPNTWSHKFVTEWIKENSGTPPIAPMLLAPTETGPQLCRIPKGEFVTRCLKTPHVTGEQAEAFWSKLWRLHIDSRSSKSSENNPVPADDGQTAPETVSFKERLKPGMFFRFKPSPGQEHDNKIPPIFMVMAPEGSIASDAVSFGNEGVKGRHICAGVWSVPIMGQDAYMLSVVSQKLVSLEQMGEEVLLDFDSASRYYFVSV